MARKTLTHEEKAVKKLETIVNDLTLDLDMVGHYLAYSRNVTYNRIKTVVEAAEYQKENIYGYSQDTLF